MATSKAGEREIFVIGKGGLDIQAALFWAPCLHSARLGRVDQTEERGQNFLSQWRCLRFHAKASPF